MCGIVGHFSLADPVDSDLVRAVARARDRLAHRGPDAAGLYASPDRRCVLASRRLAIRDLSPEGGQPVGNEDGTVQVAFNGEIYNADALRAGLIERGHRFRSRSDTEVLVHLYEERGPQLVDQLDGMFSFVIYDAERRALFGARDPLGVKPLYYALSARRFAFASEPKALLALPDVGRAPNLDELPSYLAFSCVPGPPTLHRDIHKLPPGTRFALGGDGRLRTERYWHFPASRDDGAEPAQLHGALDAALKAAVEKRLVGDVPIGATLSGGIDSSLVARHMSESSDTPVDTFTIGYPDDEAESDRFYARRVAQALGTRHHELVLDHGDFEGLLDELPALADDPNGSVSLVGYLHLARSAQRSGVRVLQIGEGADEAFAGYAAPFQLAQAQTRFAAFQPLLAPGLAVARRLADPFERLLGRAAQWAAFEPPVLEALRRLLRREAPYWGFGTVFASHPHSQPLSSRDGGTRVTPNERLLERLSLEDERSSRPCLDQLAIVDMLLQLPERLLMRADRATMRYGVEARVPFLDPAVLAVAFRIPPHLRAASEKGFLREHARRHLPAFVAERRKLGFPASAAVFLAPEARARIRERVLDRSFLELTGVVPARARELMDAADHGQGQALMPLWTLYTLSLWAHHWT